MKKLILFELRKIFARRLVQIALLVLLLLNIGLNVATYQNMYAFDGESREGRGRTAVEIDKDIAAKYEGVLTDEKVQQMLADFTPKNDLHGMNAKYLYQNSIQSAVFARFADINGGWNGQTVAGVFGDEEIRVGYVNGWLKTCQNMARIFLVLSLLVEIMIAPVFAGEYGGVDNIILTSKYGKTKCPMAKVIASLLAALLVTGIVALLNLGFAFWQYGGGGLNCSILFAPVEFTEWYIPFNITCGTLLKYQIILAFTSSISVVGITLIFSALCKNQLAALVVSAGVYLLPLLLPVSENSPLFALVALLPIYHTQYISLMSVAQMENGLLYAIFAIPAALLFIGVGAGGSCRIFAKHQVA